MAAMTDAHLDGAGPRTSIRRSELTGGRVRGTGPWAVGLSGSQPFAVSRRCRHQLADLAQGRVDADGCLVCPWHGSRYDVGTGRMTTGPHGFLGYHGPAPGYSGLVKMLGRILPLRRGRVRSSHGRLTVE
jgi:nitrite reductase/ring-hydroxylating ferredoxin subunit